VELTEAESQLIALLRGEHAKNFSVEIRIDESIWYAKLWDHDTNIAGRHRRLALCASLQPIQRRTCMASRDLSSPADRRKNAARKKTERRNSKEAAPAAKSNENIGRAGPTRSDKPNKSGK
jgi:hypothetical protein